MRLTPSQLARLAADTGFQTHNLEKVLRLIDLLNGLRGHPFLKGRIVLKGGTALNLFLFNLPRLSVDIDLNFIGAADRQAMLEERPKVEQAIRAVCEREGYQVRRLPDEHAGGKWRLAYLTVDDRPGTLELDLNFLMRIPLPVLTVAEVVDHGRRLLLGERPDVPFSERLLGHEAEVLVGEAGLGAERSDVVRLLGRAQGSAVTAVPVAATVGATHRAVTGSRARGDWQLLALLTLNSLFNRLMTSAYSSVLCGTNRVSLACWKTSYSAVVIVVPMRTRSSWNSRTTCLTRPV